MSTIHLSGVTCQSSVCQVLRGEGRKNVIGESTIGSLKRDPSALDWLVIL